MPILNFLTVISYGFVYRFIHQGLKVSSTPIICYLTNVNDYIFLDVMQMF